MGQKDAALYLDMSPRWLIDQRNAGTGPAYYTVGGRVKYSVADLDAWLSARRKDFAG